MKLLNIDQQIYELKIIVKFIFNANKIIVHILFVEKSKCKKKSKKSGENSHLYYLQIGKNPKLIYINEVSI